MRPLNLTFQAFGSYPQKVNIPFSKLPNSSVYLVSGVTGSGKTTIFDAICYALFDKPSGQNRDNINLKSHFANADSIAFVDFEFMVKGEIYRVYRSLPYEKKKPRSQGYTVQSAIAQLYLPNSKVINNIKEVNEYIINLLGMNINQFSQIALLAQGEFVRLLNSNTKDRAEIFRNIFKTNDFLDFQDKLKNKSQELKYELENYSSSLVQYLSQLEFNNEKKDKYIETSVFPLFDEFLEDLNADIKANDKELANLKNNQKALSDEIIKNKKLEQDFRIKKSLLDELDSLKKQKEQRLEIFKNIKAEFKKLPSKQKELENLALDINKSKDDYNNSLLIINTDKELEQDLKISDKLENDIKELKKSHLGYINGEIIELKNNLEKNQDKYIKLEIDVKKSDEEYLKLYYSYLAQSAGVLARELKDNSPCPVCGSLNHPNPAKTKDAISKDELDKKRQDVEKYKNQLTHLANVCNLSKKDIENKENELNLYQKEYKIKIADYITKTPVNPDEIKKLSDKYNSLKLEISNKKTKSKTLYNLLNNKNIDEILNNYNKLKSQYDELSKNIEKIKKDYEKENILNEQIKSKTELLQDRIKSYKNIDLAQFDKLSEKITSLEDEFNKLDKVISDINIKVSTNKKLYNNLKDTYFSYKIFEEKYKKFKLLSDCAAGSLSKTAKISFEQYIQGYYLDMVLSYASKHLKTMSDNQFMLERKKEASDLQTKSALELEVMDFHTFKKRSTKTLSGGESFKASLALALGLSDCISNLSGAISVDSLFIDEGFGSLDLQSLNLAMDVISNLSDNSRLVGIISHVEELKNRIQNQIITTKTLQGSIVTLNF